MKLVRKPDDQFRDARQDMDVLMPIEVCRSNARVKYFRDLSSEFRFDIRRLASPCGNSGPQTCRSHIKPAVSIHQSRNPQSRRPRVFLP